MGNGFAGLALSGLLGGDGFFDRVARADQPNAQAKPWSTLPGRRGAKSCIFLMMNGAPSQVDTFDHKPLLKKYAGKTLPADKT